MEGKKKRRAENKQVGILQWYKKLNYSNNYEKTNTKSREIAKEYPKFGDPLDLTSQGGQG